MNLKLRARLVLDKVTHILRQIEITPDKKLIAVRIDEIINRLNSFVNMLMHAKKQVKYMKGDEEWAGIFITGCLEIRTKIAKIVYSLSKLPSNNEEIKEKLRELVHLTENVFCESSLDNVECLLNPLRT